MEGFREVCRATEELVASRRPSVSRRQIDELGLNALYRLAAYAAITAKQSAWSSEEEWRQVAIPRRGVQVEDVEGFSVVDGRRHLDLSLRASGLPIALEEVILGPQQDYGAAVCRIRQILTAAGYPHVAAPLPRVERGMAP
jgi:hypothetical protein